ncbi:FMN-binding protein [Candidatus Peregrinibacteria bacterium]|nr:FMN-binding protein [Candidatus Peregrinibacteria bacterium]
MNKLSASFLAMMLLVVISACSGPETTPTPATPPSATTQTPPPATTPTSTTESATETQTTTQATTESTPSESSTPIVIADGTYTTKGNYRSPAQSEDVEFSFTIKANTVESVELTKGSTIPNSQKFQGLFMEGIKKEIIGKKLSEIGTFDRVNGSSLTPKGFNQAMTELKQKA